MRRTLVHLAVLGLAAGAALTGPVGPAAAAPTLDLEPARLARGPAPAVPYVEGSTLVDAALRIDLDAEHVTLLGRSGPAYVVSTGSGSRPASRVVRVEADGTRRVLARGVPAGEVDLSDDGSRVAWVKPLRQRFSVATAIDATTGDRISEIELRGSAHLLDVRGSKVLVSTSTPDRTSVWHTASGRVQTIKRGTAYTGSLAHDRIASFDGDPYDGGCTRVTRITRPKRVVWRSCRDALTSISPDGSRMLTMHKLTDGLGPGRVHLRTASGRLLATYEVDGWFLRWMWEDGRTVLLGANGRRSYALVRCEAAACERATATRPEIDPRATA